MTAIKICGITDDDALEACEQAAVDYVGFMTFPNSPRYVTPERYGALASACRKCQPVLVTVNASDAELESYASFVKPALIQCHGDETPARLRELKDRYSCRIIRAVSVSTVDDLIAYEIYGDSADYLLFDAHPFPGEAQGGNARAFDWALLEKQSIPMPWFLAGGLSSDNIEQALARVSPFGVDVSSGVESQRGVKDATKIRHFVELVRQRDAAAA